MLLEESLYIGVDKVNRVVPLPYELEVVPPFGPERMVVAAYSQTPPRPNVVPIRVGGVVYDGFTDASSVVARTRGLARPKDEEDVRFGEALLTMFKMIERGHYTERGGGMQTIADMLRDEGHAKGIAEGRTKGIAEGRVEAQRQMLTRLIDRRFGLTEDERGLIASCDDADRLEAAADSFADSQATKRSILDLLTGNGSR